MDFLNDKSAAVLGYAFDNNILPDFVKEASMPTQEEVKELKDIAFADPFNREFPCHTKVATVLSALYAAANMESDDIVEGINKKANAFGISDVTDSIFQHFNNTFEKIASEQDETPMVKFALSIEDEEGNVKNYYNTSTKEDTLLTLKHLEQDFSCGGLSMPNMRKVAKVVYQAAKDFDVATQYIPSVITKFATTRIPNVAVAYELIGLRKQAGVDMAQYEDVLDKMANAISDSDMSEGAILTAADEAAAELTAIDASYNIKYATDQPDPYEVIFNGPTMDEFEKFAAEHVRISEIAVPVADFVNIAEDKVNAMFSKSAAELILKSKAELEGEPSVEKSANAQTTLQGLNPEASKLLLQLLANTGW